MKTKRVAALPAVLTILLLMAGCSPAKDGEVEMIKEEGGEGMPQRAEVFQVEGNQLDRRPQQTALATFALG